MMTVGADVEAEIRRLHYAEHWPIGTIARELGVHHGVVRRALSLRAEDDPRPPPSSVVAPYAALIDEILARHPKLRASRLYDMLRARGYEGSDRTLRRYVRRVRPEPAREAFVRSNVLIGEESQVDWAKVGVLDVPGGTRALWMFVIVLSYSRAMWAELVFDQTAASLARSLTRATSFFGGATRTWLFDNPKTVVLERRGDAVRFHPLLVEVTGHYCVQAKLCAPGRGNEKGRVERTIRYIRDRFLGGRTITSIDEGNRELLAFINDIAHPRPHPTIPQRTVADVYDEEKGHLLRLAPHPFCADQVVSARADKTAFVRFDTNDYSVPSRYNRADVIVVADDRVVRVLDKGEEIARHARCWGKRQVVEDVAHRRELVAKKRRAAKGKGRDRLASLVPDIERLYQRWLDLGCNLGSMTSRTLALLDLYGDDVFIEAARDVIDTGAHDPGAIGVRCEVLRKKRQRDVPIALHLSGDVPDRDVIPHDLETYDAATKRRRDH